MHRNQAVCHLTCGNDSVDGVLDVEPLFVTPDCFHEFDRAEAS